MYCRDNDLGVLGLPVYLLVAIVVSVVVLSIFVLGVVNMSDDVQPDLVRTEIEKITSECENMFEYADSGTIVTVSVDFPSSMSFVVFGSMPVSGSKVPVSLRQDSKLCNNYYFVMDNGEVFQYYSNVRFQGESDSMFALFHDGSFVLTLELVEVGGSSFVKIYEK